MIVIGRMSFLSLHITLDDEPRKIIGAEVTVRDRFLLLLRCMIGLRVSEVTKLDVTPLPLYTNGCIALANALASA